MTLAQPITITIDGPAGSGKGTTARILAKKLGFKYLDSGAMYRAIGVYLNSKNVDITEIQSSDLAGLQLDFNELEHVTINGVDYESLIRTADAGGDASIVAAQKCVWEFVVDSGREILRRGNYVLEGRDTGSVWAPEADIKIFLTAEPRARAHRRWLELQKKGESISENEVLKQILERDDRDMSRSDGPLMNPLDGIEIDSTHLTIDEQVEKIYGIVKEKLRITKE